MILKTPICAFWSYRARFFTFEKMCTYDICGPYFLKILPFLFRFRIGYWRNGDIMYRSKVILNFCYLISFLFSFGKDYLSRAKQEN